MKSFRVPPSINSVIKLSLLSLYSTPMNFNTCGWSRLRITLTWRLVEWQKESQHSTLWLPADYPCEIELVRKNIKCNQNQADVSSRDWDVYHKITRYKEVTVGTCGVPEDPATDYQPPSGTFSASPHHSGSAPSSPSPLPWLYESPVSGTKADMTLTQVKEEKKKLTVKREWEMEADLDGLSEETSS